MKNALMLARHAADIWEVPVGAVIVKRSTGEIVGQGYNRRETARDPLAHAELEAIAQAAKRLGGWRLVDCEMYVTLEPCPMCCGAVINSRLERLIYGASDSKSGCVHSVMEMFGYPFNHRPEIVSGVLEEECSAMLSKFFRELREKRKREKESRSECLE